MPQNLSIENIFQQIQQAMYCDQWRLQTQLRKLWPQRANQPTAWQQYLQALEYSIARGQERQAAVPAITYPAELPVTQHKAEIISALNAYQVIVVAGETGSGKTTQLPKICLEMGRGIKGYIGHTQPRRVAARTVAGRIAEELQSSLGKYVGYKVRFTDQTSQDAYIKLMTDGILLAEMQQDRFLSQYDTIIIDEAHERSLNIDFLLGYLKQLLPRRPDLKIIVTSATLDPERFAHYFNDAPIIEVSGRTYPVEIIYKPIAEEVEQDQICAISQAVAEIIPQGRGDILIFLSGEREIFDTADALRKLKLPHTEVLPLYSRLSAAEQNKIFQSHTGRRIILATNVAETSLTVPGIRYVIDPGYARIKRYSYRSKIQRLPIEAISQASAKQRAGRCGRIAPGVCIRLYAAEDLLSRPEFTEPEILRSNLATVILQMTSLHLGDLTTFPFINPPDNRLIRDGYKLLEELGAIYPDKRLTCLGQQLAKLPLDPRLGRMLLAAAKEHCLMELMIIVSGLSIQDPRERPQNWQQAADERHQQFADERSDFLSLLKLWDEVKIQSQQLSNRKFRQYCRDNFLSYLRLREWQDIHAQLVEVSKELKLRINQTAADYAAIHKAILAGLLSHIGYRQDDATYLGARSTRFIIFPGSGLYKKKPRWIMAMEIVETTKLFARTVAQIEPEWIEQLGDHLIKRSYFEPHWEQRRNQVVASEKKVLYGLMVNPGKKVNYGALDPKTAREIFIRDALVQGQFTTRAAFYQHNLALLKQIEALEHKARRRDIMVDDQTLYEFYAERLPNDIYDGITFENWQKTAAADDNQKLFLAKDYLIQQQQVEQITEQYPAAMILNNVKLPLDYQFEPGHDDDGVTVTVPLSVLNQLEDWCFEWLVPGLLKEKIIALLKALPKAIRRSLMPVTHYAEVCLAGFTAADRAQPLTKALAAQLQRLTGISITHEDWQPEQLPRHLLLNFRIVDADKKLVAAGRNLSELREKLAGKVQAHLQALPAQQWERDNITRWDFGDLPTQVNLDRDGLKMVAYPTLIARDKNISLRLLADKAEARQATYYGLRELFALALARDINYLKKNIPALTKMALLFMPLGSREELVNEIINAAIQHTFLREYDAIRTKADFENVLIQHAGQFISKVNQIAGLIYQTLDIYHDVSKQLKQTNPLTQADINSQLGALFAKNFIANTPAQWLQRLPVYLKAIQMRLIKAGGNLAKEQLAIKELAQFSERYQQHLKVSIKCLVLLTEFRWLLEEYRISLFAQELKTLQPVSSKRLEKLWQDHISTCRQL